MKNWPKIIKNKVKYAEYRDMQGFRGSEVLGEKCPQKGNFWHSTVLLSVGFPYKGATLLQQAIQLNIRRMTNFLGFARGYLSRNNPVEGLLMEIGGMLKDVLTIGKKKKMAQYRLNYQLHKLNQMEDLIAKNNDHVFLKGQNFNEMR